MEKKAVSKIVLTLLLTSVLASASTVRPTRAQLGTIHIRADGSVDPLTAPISTVDNVTYTFTGNVINDSVVVERDNIVINGADFSVQGVGTGTGLDLTDRNNVTVANVTVTQFYNGIVLSNATGNQIVENHVAANRNVGIALFSSSNNNTIAGNNVDDNRGPVLGVGIAIEGFSNNNTVSGNNVTNNGSGIYPLYECSGNTVSENNVTANDYGIILLSAQGNSFFGNVLTDNGDSFRLRYSSNNTLRNNRVGESGSHFAVEGYSLSEFINDVDASNTAEGKPIYYWVNVHGASVPLDAGYVALVSCSEITVRNLHLNVTEGQSILLAYTSNSSVASNHIAANASGVEDYGVQLVFSGNNTVEENSISYRTYAISLQNYCTDNVVAMNNISQVGQGIDLSQDSTSNFVYNNNLTDVGNGIILEYDSNLNAIIGNSITQTFVYAVRISFSSNNNLITRNDVTNSSAAVALEYSSSNNLFYDNNFINNTRQVNLYEQNSPNSWDNGLEGNRWSDYIGTDADADGIGDVPYIIDANNTDNYPLMGRFSDFKATSENHVQTICNSTISDLNFNGTAIVFNVSDENGAAGFCRIRIPTALMNATFEVFVNGTAVAYDLLPFSNATDSYLYFTYSNSPQQVIIMPEMSTWTPILLALVTLTAAAVIHKRRHLKTSVVA